MQKELQVLKSYVSTLEAKVSRLEKEGEKEKGKWPFHYTTTRYNPLPTPSTSQQPPKRKAEEALPVAKAKKQKGSSQSKKEKGGQPLTKKALQLQAEKQGLMLVAKVE